MKKVILFTLLSLFTCAIVNAQSLTYFGSDESAGTNIGQSGSHCSFFGHNAGLSNTGSRNSFIGANAGYSNTTGTQNSFVGTDAGHFNTIGGSNSFIGKSSGYSNTTGSRNSFVGFDSGYSNTTGFSNSFIGTSAGRNNTTGSHNSFVGANVGQNNTTGYSNSFLGDYAGRNNTIGRNNSFVGVNAGGANTTGSNNSFIGVNAGRANTIGNANVFLGYQAGFYELGSDKLYIDNSGTSTPLIYGDFANDELTFNGTVSIATPNMPPMTAADGSPYRLYVNGGILTKEAKVELGWADHVFEEDYCRTTLEEEAQFIAKNGHLKGFESAEAMDGKINLGDVTLRQQVKIEEMRLDQIESDQKIQKQEQQITAQQQEITAQQVQNTTQQQQIAELTKKMQEQAALNQLLLKRIKGLEK